jgi:hypothetical protein
LASNAKKKTTFAKLKREQDVRERRERKLARREARKHEPPVVPPPTSTEDMGRLLDYADVEGVIVDEEPPARLRDTPPS